MSQVNHYDAGNQDAYDYESYSEDEAVYWEEDVNATEDSSPVSDELGNESAFYGDESEPSAQEQLKTLEKSVQKNKDLTKKQREEELEEIHDLMADLKENSDEESLDFETKIQSIKQKIDALENVNEKLDQEAKRSAGIGEAIAQELNRAFQASGSNRVAGDASGEMAAASGTVLGAAAGGIAAATVAGAATASMAAVGSGVAIGATMGSVVPILGTGIGALVGFGAGVLVGNLLSETKGPKSKLKHLPPTGKRLDVIMHGKSGLGGSSVPSEVARTLYDTKLSDEERVKKLQTGLNTLPVASRAYALSLIVSLIQANDPKKLDFLGQNCPETMGYLNQALRAGASAINTGNMTLGGGKGYKISFKDGKYKIKNTDTSMFRDDWDDYKISASDISQPILDALQQVQSFSTNAGLNEPESMNSYGS